MELTLEDIKQLITFAKEKGVYALSVGDLSFRFSQARLAFDINREALALSEKEFGASKPIPSDPDDLAEEDDHWADEKEEPQDD